MLGTLLLRASLRHHFYFLLGNHLIAYNHLINQEVCSLCGVMQGIYPKWISPNLPAIINKTH